MFARIRDLHTELERLGPKGASRVSRERRRARLAGASADER